MCTFLMRRDQSLMRSLASVSFWEKGVKGFKLWDPKANKVVISRDVVFDEKPMLQCTQK